MTCVNGVKCMEGDGWCRGGIRASVPATRVQFPEGHPGRRISPHMGRLEVPLEQGESSRALVLMDMVLNLQPTNQPIKCMEISKERIFVNFDEAHAKVVKDLYAQTFVQTHLCGYETPANIILRKSFMTKHCLSPHFSCYKKCNQQ